MTVLPLLFLKRSVKVSISIFESWVSDTVPVKSMHEWVNVSKLLTGTVRSILYSNILHCIKQQMIYLSATVKRKK